MTVFVDTSALYAAFCFDPHFTEQGFRVLPE